MPPVPPRRKTPPLLAPRDVTETARQGQGIGDLEAMRQMATTAIPEVLRNAPVTSTPMSVFDMARAVADRDLAGAGMAALGAIPFAGMLRHADEAAKIAKSLPIDEASRVARGEKYFPEEEVFHSTGATQPFEEFTPFAGGQWHDLLGTHVGTLKAAQQRAEMKFGIESWDKPMTKKRYMEGGQQAPSIMPLRMRMENPYLNQGVPFKEKELGEAVRTFAEKEGFLTKGGNKYGIPGAEVVGEKGPDYLTQMAAAQKAFVDRVKAAGHDVIPYVNNWEDKDSMSYLVLEPNRLRSRYAQFDPAKLESKGLMAGLAAMLGGSALRQSSGSSER